MKLYEHYFNEPLAQTGARPHTEVEELLGMLRDPFGNTAQHRHNAGKCRFQIQTCPATERQKGGITQSTFDAILCG